MKERDYLWDNIKALLIFFVVAGHALEMTTLRTDLSLFMDNFIYSFHMPAFMFVSGFFLKKYCVDGKVRAQKAAVIFAYYIIFQLLFILLRLAVGLTIDNFELFNPSRGLWYLMALFFYYLITPIIEKLPPWFVLPLFVVLALLIANDTNASAYFSILRIATFAPYFAAGYYLSAEAVKKLRSLKAYIKYPAALVCACASVFIWQFNCVKPWLKLFFGKINNENIGLDFGEATLLRLECYATAFLMIAALLLAMPSKKTIFSKIGQNSLPIFIFHMALVIAIFDSGLLIIKVNSDWIFALEMLASAAVTVLFSLDIFQYPFKWIQMGVNRLYGIKQ